MYHLKTLKDIENLIEMGVMENDKIEYKSIWKEKGDNEEVEKKRRSELIKDVCAFANAEGGVIVYGVKESKNETPEISDFKINNFDEISRRIIDIIREQTDPPLVGITPCLIRTLDGNGIIVLNILKAMILPHRSKLDQKYYIRTNNKVTEMTTAMLSDKILGFNYSERVENFIEDRWKKINENKVDLFQQHSLEQGSVICMHLVPIADFRTDYSLVLYDTQIKNCLIPMNGGNQGDVKPNRDCLFSEDYKNNSPYSYTQLYRNGTIEAVGTISENMDQINFNDLEKLIIRQFKSYQKISAFFNNINTPFVIYLSVWRFVGSEFGITRVYGDWKAIISKSNEVVVPVNKFSFNEQYINGINDDAGLLLKPLFDKVWNVIGRDRSPNYNENGTRKE